jgi:hypothetical protein
MIMIWPCLPGIKIACMLERQLIFWDRYQVSGFATLHRTEGAAAVTLPCVMTLTSTLTFAAVDMAHSDAMLRAGLNSSNHNL